MTKEATCPVCGRRVKLTPKGRLHKHGFAGRRRCLDSKCYGSSAEPEKALARAVAILDYYIEAAVSFGSPGPETVARWKAERDGYVAQEAPRG
jgi:hypothetical protein